MMEVRNRSTTFHQNRRRFFRRIAPLGLVLAFHSFGCEREGGTEADIPAAPLAKPAPASVRGLQRRGDFRAVKQKARAWFDQLEVDPVLLLKKGIKGKKKLAEILDVYLSYQKHAAEAAERQSILARARALARQTERPEYHDMLRLSDEEFTQNSMSYLRVAWLLEQLGLDIKSYRQEILKIKPRLDSHMAQRGPWQRAMFAEYYDRFGLEKPPALLNSPMQQGIVSRRLPAARYSDNDTYDFTHELFVAFDYGLKRAQNRFAAADLVYSRDTLRQLLPRYVRENNPDLAGELLSGMTYLGWHEDAEYQQVIDFLLDGQNKNGTWGSYEAHRQIYGPYLEHHVYLHTTMVVIQALLEAFEGGWPAAAEIKK
ncbi:MAG: hypothetical protein HY717_12495 [Planctomycetes bacterium]|nr:hypothetical protein [Planctomycetota bacterium]